jgi:hypothetical protein
MLSRLRWFLAGVVTGALGAVYGLYRLRTARRRVVEPDQLIDTVGGGLRSAGRSVRHAWDESREAIDEAEHEMRRSYVDKRPPLRDVNDL